MKKRQSDIWAICLAALGVILAAIIALSPPAASVSDRIATTTPLGGAFTLVNGDGKTVTEHDFADKQKLIFFGFTFCPSVCPSEMLKMSDVMDALGPKADKIVPIFITLDPARDTPDIMKKYTGKFDDRIVGLTGSQEQIDAVVHAFKVYAAKVPQGKTYTVDHSAFMYLTDDKNHMVKIYAHDTDAEQIAADLKERL